MSRRPSPKFLPNVRVASQCTQGDAGALAREAGCMLTGPAIWFAAFTVTTTRPLPRDWHHFRSPPWLGGRVVLARKAGSPANPSDGEPVVHALRFRSWRHDRPAPPVRRQWPSTLGAAWVNAALSEGRHETIHAPTVRQHQRQRPTPPARRPHLRSLGSPHRVSEGPVARPRRGSKRFHEALGWRFDIDGGRLRWTSPRCGRCLTTCP